ncbi:hypothetical protein BVRB_2g023830 isoform B [Beta vulgaris subsp. vulgaris]|nr:hypothetical protein BVRB_2g023830 isoform B [Beta vulgaris subsp. vulgaris]
MANCLGGRDYSKSPTPGNAHSYMVVACTEIVAI